MEDIEMGSRDASASAFGFPAMAAVVATDADYELFVFRKFDRLSARNLINMQNEIQHLEQRQQRLDHELLFSDDDILCTAMRNYDELKDQLQIHPMHSGIALRKRLQEEIAEKMDVYQKALLQQHEIAKLERPAPLALKTYREAIFGEGKYPAKVGGSTRHLMDKCNEHDLVALNRPVDRDVLSRLVRQYWPFAGDYVVQHEEARSFEERSLILLVRRCSMVVAALLMIGSILALHFVTNQDKRLGLVIAFVVLFAIGMAICTGASRDSIFVGTAAYAAVLIVFVSGNLSNGQKP